MRTANVSLPIALAIFWSAGSSGVRAEGPLPDGTLLDATVVTPQAETLERVDKYWAEGRTVLEGVELKAITYLSDGLKVKGYLARPKQGTKLPGVIWNRGGNREFGALDEVTAALDLACMASWGYVVVASQYRGNAGGEGVEEFGGKDVNDVLNLIPLLKALPEADGTRIGMYGWSRGGMMTYQAMARTEELAAAIVGAGPTDLFDGLKRRPEMEQFVMAQLVPNFAASRDEALAARSVLRWPEKLSTKTPLLILHGSADWRVSPTDSIRLVSRLVELKRPVRFVLFEGGDHGISEHQPEVNRITREWLDRYVRDGEAWPSLEPHGR